MDLQLNHRRKHKNIISDDLSDLYPHDISLYTIPPPIIVAVSEFEDLALDRLKTLRIIEFASEKGFKIFGAEWKQFIYQELQKENLKQFLRLIKSSGTTNPSTLDYQARRADHISHFILRMAYCRTDELRKWFLYRELELFKLRFMELSAVSVAQFMEHNNLPYTVVTEIEKLELRDELYKSTVGYFVFPSTTFYKVPFTKVCNLVKGRKVFVKLGVAYVPNFEMVHCICTILRDHLSEGLALTCRRLSELDDHRINRFLENIHNIFTGDSYNEDDNKTKININKYAKQHFPLCMRHIHNIFKSTHHLKHGCRLQYSLFLKGIGLDYEDCLQYWREEFTKIIDGDKFDKQYAYGIKHVYGKVGRMVNYSPYSCISIIKNSVGPGDQHGCPYKNWDSAYLKDKLLESGINAQGVNEIVGFAHKGHYQVACDKYFKFTHGGVENKNVINHPNQYFMDSYNLQNEDTLGPQSKSEPMET